MVAEGTVCLWALERHDLLQNYQWANDPELIRYAGLDPVPKSAAGIEQWLDHVSSQSDLQVLSIKTEDGDYLGNIELTAIDRRSRKAEIGLMLGVKDSWGKGFARDALKGMCRYGFQELGLHRIYARVLQFNQRAHKLFERNGFRDEGVEREGYFAAGRFWDVHVYAVLAREFEEHEKNNKKTKE